MLAKAALQVIANELRENHNTIADLIYELSDADRALDLAQSCMEEGCDRDRVIAAHKRAKAFASKMLNDAGVPSANKEQTCITRT